jgi:hypothetical protein
MHIYMYYLVFKEMLQFNRRDVPDDICDGFHQFKECVKTVFVNAFHCSLTDESLRE